MILDLPVSSSEFSLTDSPKTPCFRMEKLILVPSSVILLQEIPFSQSHSISEGKRKEFLHSIFSDPVPKCMDLLQEALSLCWNEEIAEFLASDIRDSTVHQYESIWSFFVVFLRSINPLSLAKNIFFNF